MAGWVVPEPAHGSEGYRSVEDELADSATTLAPIAEPTVLDPESGDAVPPGELRTKTARGVLVNSGFRIGIAGIGLVRNVGIAAFITASEYGLWALILTTLITLAFLKQVGIGDKYIQQRERDQAVAYQKAFSLELSYTLLFFVVVAIALPIYALVVFDRPDILAPGFVASLTLIATAFQTPTWIFYRRLEYFRQRSIEAVDPVVTTVAILGLLIAGTGVWGLAIGTLTGAVAGAIAATVASPYPLGFRLDRGALREYFSFSWPLFVGGIGSLLVVQGTVIIGNAALGLAAVGAIGLAGNFARFSSSVEHLLNMTLYPAVCRVQDRRDVLLEVFTTSNRLALVWALPFGIGLALFASDIGEYFLGPSWDEVVPLMQLFGITTGLGAIAFAWGTFYKALGRTRPIAVAGVVSVAVFFAVTVPLMLTVGVIGYGIGMAASTLVLLVMRAHYLRKLFPGFNLFAHAARALAPVLPAVAAVLLVRMIDVARTPVLALLELCLYAVVVAAMLFVFERRLLKEALGYIRGSGRREQPSPGPAAA